MLMGSQNGLVLSTLRMNADDAAQAVEALNVWRLPTLIVLKLHSCEGITSASMAAISHSYSLKLIDIGIIGPATPGEHKACALSRMQESLTSLALQCPFLQEVDLTECESLTNSICEVFSDEDFAPIKHLFGNDFLKIRSHFMTIGNSEVDLIAVRFSFLNYFCVLWSALSSKSHPRKKNIRKMTAVEEGENEGEDSKIESVVTYNKKLTVVDNKLHFSSEPTKGSMMLSLT
ncbi:unnamed protein product [Fraxinus pennsylvanica]|uniref:Uncharacterized protein n=1 Tax=Fraxinus pennsylvanica TaxID=56036 RepID=A0AAD2EE40_9LAMI|nr:unnamed protein product [Fraxinus pennsylvanica]